MTRQRIIGIFVFVLFPPCCCLENISLNTAYRKCGFVISVDFTLRSCASQKNKSELKCKIRAARGTGSNLTQLYHASDSADVG